MTAIQQTVRPVNTDRRLYAFRLFSNFPLSNFAFNVLTLLLVGWQEGHPACKKN